MRANSRSCNAIDMSSTAPARISDLFRNSLGAASAGAVALISMIAFEAIAVAAAMPTVATALDGVDLYALTFGGAIAAGLVAMVVAGIDCDSRGPRRSMTAGLLLFGLGLLLAGSAHHMVTLVIGRIAQGLGGGAIGVAIYVAAARLYPPELRPRLFATFAAAWALPAVVGPGLAALIVQSLGWRWVFLSVLCLLPVCAFLLLPPLSKAASHETSRGWNRDAYRRLGWSVLAAMSALGLHRLSEAPANLPNAMAAMAALGLLALGAIRLLPRGTLHAAPGLPTAIALRGLLASAFLGTEVFIPLWLNLHAGWSIATAGLSLTLGALCWSAGSAWQARLTHSEDRIRALRIGLLLASLGMAGQLLSIWSIFPAWCMPALWALVGFGTGIAFPTITVLALNLSPPAEQGRNSAALQLSEAFAHTTLLAVVGFGFARLQADAPLAAFSLVFSVPAMQCALAFLISARVHTPGTA